MKRVIAIMLSISMLVGLCYIPASITHAEENAASTEIANNEILIGECEDGTVSVTPASAEVGETVTIFPKGTNSNYEVDKVYVQIGDNEKQEVEFSTYGYTFVKEDAVTTVSATFMKRLDVNEDAKKGEEDLKSIHQYIVGSNSTVSENELVRADRNSDDTTDVFDVVRYKKQEAQKAAGVSLTMEAENALCKNTGSSEINVNETYSRTIYSVYLQENTMSIDYKINSTYDTTVQCLIKLRHRNSSVAAGKTEYNLTDLVKFQLKNGDDDYQTVETTGTTTIDLWKWDTDKIPMYESVVATLVLKAGENHLKISPATGMKSTIDNITFVGDATDLEFVKECAPIRFEQPDGKAIKNISGVLNKSIESYFPADASVSVESGLDVIGWTVPKDTVLTKKMTVKALQGAKFKFEAEDSVTTSGGETAFISTHDTIAAKSVYMKRGLTNLADSVVTMDYVVYYSGSKSVDFLWDIIMCHRSGGKHTLDDMMDFSISYDGGTTYSEVNTNGILDNKADIGGAAFATARIGNITLKPGENHLRIKGIKGLYANVDYITLTIQDDKNRLNTDGVTIEKTIADAQVVTAYKIDEIRNSANMTIPAGATVYYVAANGSDDNDGTSTSTPWKTLEKVNAETLAEGSYVCFKRGDTWRGQLKTQAGVTYTAYGTGNKPQFFGSPADAADASKWTLVDGTTNVWKYADEVKEDVGTIIFDHDSNSVGSKIVLQNVSYLKSVEASKGLDFDIDSSYNNETLVNQATMKAFTGKSDMEDSQFFHRTYNSNYHAETGFDKNYVYLCSDTNPGTKYSSIEFLTNKSVILVDDAENVTLDNLSVKYTGAHGVSATHAGKTDDYANYDLNLVCTNMEIGDIGGSLQTEPNLDANIVRYGNGIQVWEAFDGLTVKGCYIYNCYDAGVTPQTDLDEGKDDMKNILIQGNVIERCTYNIEYFTQTLIENFEIRDNYLLSSGTGIGEVRLDVKEAAFIKSWHHANVTTNFVIDNNFMMNAKDYVVQTQSSSPNAQAAVYTNNTIIASTQNYSTNGYIKWENWEAAPSNYLQAFDETFEYNLNGGYVSENPNVCWFAVGDDVCGNVCGVCYKCTDASCTQSKVKCSGHALKLEAEEANYTKNAGVRELGRGTGNVVLNMGEATSTVYINYYITVTEDVYMKFDITAASRAGGNKSIPISDYINTLQIQTPVESELQNISTEATIYAPVSFDYNSLSSFTISTVADRILLKKGTNHIRIGAKAYAKIEIDSITLTGDTSKIQNSLVMQAEDANLTMRGTPGGTVAITDTQNKTVQSVYMRDPNTNGRAVTIDYTITADREMLLVWDITMGHRDGGSRALDDMLDFKISYDGGVTYETISTEGVLTNAAWGTSYGDMKTVRVGLIRLKKGENHLQIFGPADLKANIDSITLIGDTDGLVFTPASTTSE